MGDTVVPHAESGVERLSFVSRHALAGEFRCTATYPGFHDAGRIHNYVVAFPRSAVWIHREDQRAFVADPSIATIYAPGQAYQRSAISAEGDHSDYYAVSEPVARDIVARFDVAAATGPRVFTHARAAVTSDLYFAQRQLSLHLRQAHTDALEAEERVIGVVAAVVRAAYASSSRPRQRRAAPDLVERAKEVLMATLYENLGVTDLAAQLHVSPYHLCRRFRQVTGTTLHEHRRMMRLRSALGLTASYRGNLSALALRAGFSSHAHFATAFRETFGTSPSRTAAGHLPEITNIRPER